MKRCLPLNYRNCNVVLRVYTRYLLKMAIKQIQNSNKVHLPVPKLIAKQTRYLIQSVHCILSNVYEFQIVIALTKRWTTWAMNNDEQPENNFNTIDLKQVSESFSSCQLIVQSRQEYWYFYLFQGTSIITSTSLSEHFWVVSVVVYKRTDLHAKVYLFTSLLV